MRASVESPSPRLLLLDALRGFIIVVMALDHANALIAHGKLSPELWAGRFPDYRGDTLAFLTRAVTHLAAPSFFFLLGAGMVGFAQTRRDSGWDNWRIVGHFVVRGALLIGLQFLLENRAWSLGGSLGATYVGVLYALGGAMIAGAFLVRLPTPALLTVSLMCILGTDILLPDNGGGSYTVWARLVYAPGFSDGLYVLYPLLPWLGVAGLGMIYGRWLGHDRAAAYRGARWLGVGGLIAFSLLRLLNLGDVRPLPAGDWIAFLNVVKYPPSLTFLLLTLGVNLLLLSLLERLARIQTNWLWPLAVFGRAPLCFYLTHLFLYGSLGLWLAPGGMPIPQMYPYWLLGLVILFPLCWAYGRFKASRPPESLWRLL
jgi:uncharacterized membrane protein